jgi:hypothetical protein
MSGGVSPANAVDALSSKGAPKGAPKGGRSKRAEIVKKVMKEKGLSMIAASKHVKEHNLY